MSAYSHFPRIDTFQQIVYTPAGTIDVIATDQRARLQNAQLLARGVSFGFGALRRGAAYLLRAVAGWLDHPARVEPQAGQ